MDERLESLVTVSPKVDLSDRQGVALVIIDMQYHDASPEHGLTRALSDMAPGSMDYYSRRLRETTIPAIQRLLAFFRAEDLSIIHLVLGSEHQDLRDCPPRFRDWTRNMERVTGLNDIWWTRNPDFEILSELSPKLGEHIVRKTTNGAFNGSNIKNVLKNNNISKLIITGAVTSACVETTARDAADRGYHCVIVGEATADYDPDMQAATMRAFSLNLGRIVETADHAIDALTNGEYV